MKKLEKSRDRVPLTKHLLNKTSPVTKRLHNKTLYTTQCNRAFMLQNIRQQSKGSDTYLRSSSCIKGIVSRDLGKLQMV
jgi:hypothetical protein